MKKIISIILALSLSLGIFSVAVSAEETRLEKFVNTIATSNNVHISVDDDLVNDLIGIDGIEFKDVELAASFEEKENGEMEYSVAAAAKISIFKCKIIITPEESILYIPTLLLRVNLDNILGEGVVYNSIYDLVDELRLFEFSELPVFLDYFKFVSESKETYIGDDEYDCETYAFDLDACLTKLIESGEIQLEEGVVPEDLTTEEIIELIYNSDAQFILEEYQTGFVKAYFENDVLVGLMTVNSEGYTHVVFFFPEISLTFNSDNGIFKKPFTLFDISRIFQRIIALF